MPRVRVHPEGADPGGRRRTPPATDRARPAAAEPGPPEWLDEIRGRSRRAWRRRRLLRSAEHGATHPASGTSRTLATEGADRKGTTVLTRPSIGPGTNGLENAEAMERRPEQSEIWKKAAG